MNVDKCGVLQSFQGGRVPHFGSFIFDMFPEHPALIPTIEKMMENYDPEIDAYNFHGVSRYAEKAFPWSIVGRCRSFEEGRPATLGNTPQSRAMGQLFRRLSRTHLLSR